MLTKMLHELQVVKDQVAAMTPSDSRPADIYQHSYHRSGPRYEASRPYPDTRQPPAHRTGVPTRTWSQLSQYEPPRAVYSQLHSPWQTPQYAHPVASPAAQERTYRGPQPTIPDFCSRDPSEFTRLRIALENLLPPDATELFSYQILLDHLKLEEARLIADSFLNSPYPFSDTMAALNERYGQPHRLALQKIAQVMDSPDIKRGDAESFERFALLIQSLVGMLQTLGREGQAELSCGSHVERLLSKLPAEMRAAFRRQLGRRAGTAYTLMELADWLHYEAWCQGSDSQFSTKNPRPAPKPEQRRDRKPATRSATVLHGTNTTTEVKTPEPSPSKALQPSKTKVSKVFCPYCNNDEHYLSQCAAFKAFSKDQMIDWIRTNRRCWRCARSHQAAQCTLKKACNLCNGKHLQILHEVNAKPTNQDSCLLSSTTETLYLDRPADDRKVLLKVIGVVIHHQGKSLNTYAILDDGSERAILLAQAAAKLDLRGPSESLALRTIRHDISTINGSSVSFQISPATQPQKRFQITCAFTAQTLGLAEHSYPASVSQRFQHLKNLPIQSFEHAHPLLLIGADHTHLITPTAPVRLSSPDSPAAIKTRLGWVLQGPARHLQTQLLPQQCLHISINPAEAELKRNVEKLWQLDQLPYRCKKQATRSKEDQEAISLLEAKTIRQEVNGVFRYATPLLRKKDFPQFQAPKEAVMPQLRGTERRLAKDPVKATAYTSEVHKLQDSGAVAKLPSEETPSGEMWYLPHHLVSHNGKDRLVFNCSFRYGGLNLNEWLLPGPTLSPSLLGVLVRFREHSVAISGDIRGMFHQVLLLPEDKPLLRFLWRDLQSSNPPDVFEWQVLPFGTTCSPCCASFALQRHITLHSTPDEDIRFSVERSFYVDNCLQSFPSCQAATHMVNKLRAVLATGGFEIRQWASNMPEVVRHLPPEARSPKLELWLSQDKTEAQESTLGLSWNCNTDHLGFKHRPVTYDVLTMRTIYRVLATQYDPLGAILPFTTRAKVIV